MMKILRLDLKSLKKTLLLLSVPVTLLWPFIVYYAFKVNAEIFLVTAMIVFFTWRMVAIGNIKKQGRVLLKATRIASIVVIMLALSSWFLERYTLLHYYPVVINAVFLGAFLFSLIKPPTVITFFAMVTEATITPALISYTFKVTCIWCVFFTFNGVMAFFTVLSGDDELWLLWNGCISYFIAGAIMGGEFLIRKHIKKHADQE